MLRQRVISALVLVPVVLLAAYLGGMWFLALVLAAALLASHEFTRMTQQAGHHPSLLLGLALVGALIAGARFQSLTSPALATLLILTFAWQVLAPQRQRSLTDWSLTLAGALYIGWLGSYLVAIRELSQGFTWLLWVLLTTWANDSGAYLVGHALGRRPFAPQISPRKTWEGAIGGWLSCLLVSGWLGWWSGVDIWLALGLGVVLGPVATLGDLSVSFLKRQVGVKDTSSLIPGHGGMLDRMDSLLFSAVVVYYFALWM